MAARSGDTYGRSPSRTYLCAAHGRVQYAAWITHIDGTLDQYSPRLVVTNGRLQFGDKLPLANVSCWITEVIEGQWTDEAGQKYDGRVRAAAGPRRDPDA